MSIKNVVVLKLFLLVFLDKSDIFIHTKLHSHTVSQLSHSLEANKRKGNGDRHDSPTTFIHLCLTEVFYLRPSLKVLMWAEIFYVFGSSVRIFVRNFRIRKHSNVIFIPAEDNVTFLRSIVEVGGSLIISRNHVSRLALPNLKVVRGKYLHNYGRSNVSVFIVNNVGPSKKAAVLDLRSLKCEWSFLFFIWHVKNAEFGPITFANELA